MVTFTEGVEFDTVAREWRCKWSADNDKASLVSAQKALNEVLSDIKSLIGVKEVQRVVCGSCLDYKVIISLSIEGYGIWKETEFAPEKDFLDKIEGIDGISAIETQTFTLMKM
jgi:uncharacterized protein YlaN (UPF0358 family)